MSWLRTKETDQGYTPTKAEAAKVVEAASEFDDLWKTVLVKLCAELGLRTGGVSFAVDGRA